MSHDLTESERQMRRAIVGCGDRDQVVAAIAKYLYERCNQLPGSSPGAGSPAKWYPFRVKKQK